MTKPRILDRRIVIAMSWDAARPGGRCGACDGPVEFTMGPVFCDTMTGAPSLTLVCSECAKKEDPHLAALMEMVRAAFAFVVPTQGRMAEELAVHPGPLPEDEGGPRKRNLGGLHL